MTLKGGAGCNYWGEKGRTLIKRYWGLDLFIPVHLNGRLSKTLGTYKFKVVNDEVIPLHIELSRDLVTYGSRCFVELVLKHELCHFVLSQLRKPYRDGDDFFEKELKRIKAFSTREIYVYYRNICVTCQRVYYHISKKEARLATNESCYACSGKLEKYDVYYQTTS